MKVRLLSKDVATLAGNWEFTFDGKRGTPVKARVLVVWKKYNRVTIGGVKKRVRASTYLGWGFVS